MPQRNRHNTQTGQQAIKGSLSSSQKAVGGSIPLEVGSYSPQQEKGSHGADAGLSGESISLSGKVLFCSVEAPLPSGYSRHHERAELRRQAPRWGSSTRQRATSCSLPDPTG